MLDKNILKNWFKTRAKPTQSQFWQWIDACFFHGEKLEQSDVNGLGSSLASLQQQINDNIPNQLISGGNVSISVDDGTTLSIYLPETKYKIKRAPFTQLARTFNLALRPASGLFRIDVFYLDATGFHIVTGAVSPTPVKPGAPDGSLELSNILIGFDNTLGVTPAAETPDLSAVLAATATPALTMPLTDGKLLTDADINKAYVDAQIAFVNSQIPSDAGNDIFNYYNFS